MQELMTKKDAIEYLLYMKHDVQAKSPMDIALDTAIEALKQPTIEAEPVRRGRWIETTVRGNQSIICSACSAENQTICPSNFCPNCGARMDLRTPTEVQLDEADDVMMGGADI